jgi:hypothetical protein
MKKFTLPVAFVGGFSSGFIIGISIKTGYDISKEGILSQILGAFCTYDNNSYSCNLLWLMGFIGIFTLIEDVLTNGLMYAFGLFVAIFIVMIS